MDNFYHSHLHYPDCAKRTKAPEEICDCGYIHVSRSAESIAWDKFIGSVAYSVITMRYKTGEEYLTGSMPPITPSLYYAFRSIYEAGYQAGDKTASEEYKQIAREGGIPASVVFEILGDPARGVSVPESIGDVVKWRVGDTATAVARPSDLCVKCGKPVTLGDGKTQSEWGENIRCHPECAPHSHGKDASR